MVMACSINIISKKFDKYFNTLKINFNDVKPTSKYVRYGIISK